MRNFPRLLPVFAGTVALFLAAGLSVNAQQATKSSVASGSPTALEAEVIQEINFARANPAKYAGYLEESRKYYNGTKYLPPSRTKPINTYDGLAAVDEAIGFLKTLGPLGPLQVSTGLACGARDHAQDMALKGTSGHRGSDGSLPNDRISRYGTWKNAMGEAIVYRVGTAREMVLDLIIDDGNPGRPHRKNVFESGFKLAGVSISPQSTQGTFCVIDYAGEFVEKAGATPAAAATGEAKTVATTATTTTSKATTKTPAAPKAKAKTTKRL
ncbi:MAG: hypothetical protein QOD75_1781 [Blastocatellia bacterium]|nr:hypothetical protein [Blastocatellia bacterium]